MAITFGRNHISSGNNTSKNELEDLAATSTRTVVAVEVVHNSGEPSNLFGFRKGVCTMQECMLAERRREHLRTRSRKAQEWHMQEPRTLEFADKSAGRIARKMSRLRQREG